MNGHCAYSFSGGISSIECNTLWGVDAASFPPQVNEAYFHLYGIGRDSEAQFDDLCRRAREANPLLYQKLDEARRQMTVRP
jgi:hypothetical protein